MPQKRQADSILLLTFLGLSGLVGAVTRTYHIGIVEEYWNYVPQGKNIITGKSFTEDKWVKLGYSETPSLYSLGRYNGWWWCCLVTQWCPTLWDFMDCSPPGSSVHGTFLARILEWVSISFSRESNPCLLHWQVGSWSFSHLGSPCNGYELI